MDAEFLIPITNFMFGTLEDPMWPPCRIMQDCEIGWIPALNPRGTRVIRAPGPPRTLAFAALRASEQHSAQLVLVLAVVGSWRRGKDFGFRGHVCWRIFSSSPKSDCIYPSTALRPQRHALQASGVNTSTHLPLSPPGVRKHPPKALGSPCPLTLNPKP